MYEKELQRILNASQNNALTFFVGAGVSALSGAPTWKALIHAISDKLGRTRKDEYSSDENLQIPQMFYYSLGENKEEYYRFVKEQLYSASLLPNTIHREMLNLNPVSLLPPTMTRYWKTQQSSIAKALRLFHKMKMFRLSLEIDLY